ncbi:PIN domain-containing protein [Chitinophaga alhagiae]|uniref:PIN domain-containing protein n=1 Tax=Chitinophaga alhagiae TaxID=2203219 RepID=A0ABN5LLW7_9BACT|nr:PIN domain-containing protein [Chitinophaga alhagiae]AWO00366.1 PIN domain-containing protein [Chitinophaga alhagiae]
MNDTEKFVVVLDANVLYPAPLRDFFLRLAETGLYIPKWSDEIHDEWIRNLLLKRPDLKEAQLNRARQAMDSAFPDSNVAGFKSLIAGLSLPDSGDRHVLAAAIKCGARMIITFNKKDFPAKHVKTFNLEIKNPDEFVMLLLKVNQPKVLHALRRQVSALKNPPQSREQVLSSLKKCGLAQSGGMLAAAPGLA